MLIQRVVKRRAVLHIVLDLRDDAAQRGTVNLSQRHLQRPRQRDVRAHQGSELVGKELDISRFDFALANAHPPRHIGFRIFTLLHNLRGPVAHLP